MYRYNGLVDCLSGREMYEFESLCGYMNIVCGWVKTANKFDRLFNSRGYQVIILIRERFNDKPELTFYPLNEFGNLVEFARDYEGECWEVLNPFTAMALLDQGEEAYALAYGDDERDTYYWSADNTYEAFTI